MKFKENKILEYYDGPLIFTAKDGLDNDYIFTWAWTEEKPNEYYGIPVSKKLMADFEARKINLNIMYENAGIYYLTVTSDDKVYFEAELYKYNEEFFPLDFMYNGEYKFD